MVEYNKTKVRVYSLFMMLLMIIFIDNASAAEKIDWKGNEPETGNRLAVLEFSSDGISVPMQNLLTEQFRKNINKLGMYEVLDASMTNQVGHEY